MSLSYSQHPSKFRGILAWWYISIISDLYTQYKETWLTYRLKGYCMSTIYHNKTKWLWGELCAKRNRLCWCLSLWININPARGCVDCMINAYAEKDIQGAVSIKIIRGQSSGNWGVNTVILVVFVVVVGWHTENRAIATHGNNE